MIQLPGQAPLDSRPAPWISIRATLLVLGAILAWQLFVPPAVGLADNGDFPRLMGRFDLGHPTAVYEEQYFGHFIAHYRIGPRYRWLEGLPSSELMLIDLAVRLNRWVTKPEGWFDIRVLGFVHAGLLVLIAGVLLAQTAALGRVARVGLAVSLWFVFADVGYVAYFNSFYSESATFLFLLLTLAAFGWLVGGRPTLAALAAYTVAIGLLACAKAQNAPVALLATVFLVRLASLRPDRTWRRACCMAALALGLAGGLYLRSSEGTMARIYPYVSVFMVLLSEAPDPAADLTELGFEASLARYVNVSPFAPENPLGSSAFDAAFTQRYSAWKLLSFYLRHPRRTLAALERCAPLALSLRPPLGNFERSSGAPPYGKSQAFSVWSRFRLSRAPHTALGLFGGLTLWAGSLLVARQRASQRQVRLALEGLLLLLAMAVSEYVLVALTAGLIDTAKHMHLFSLLLDVALVGTGLLVAWRVTHTQQAYSTPSTTRGESPHGSTGC